MADGVPPDSDRLLGGLGVVAATVGLVLAGGVWGVLAGFAVALAWYVLPATYAFAVGQILVVAVLSAEVPLVATVIGEAGLLAVLAGSLTTTDEPARTVAALAVATLALGAVGWGVLRSGRPLWIVAVAIAVVATTTAYGLHRYERVRLGLVEDDTQRDDRAQSGEVA